MIRVEDLTTLLQEAFPQASVQVVDATGNMDHFNAVIVCDSFQGVPKVRRHKAVYAALGDAMHSRIHALALKTYTAEEYKKVAG